MTTTIDFYAQGRKAYLETEQQPGASMPLRYLRGVYNDLLTASGQRRHLTTYRAFLRGYSDAALEFGWVVSK